MSVTDETDEPAPLSLREMREWLSQELKDLEKARELRIREATALVESHANGELSPRETRDRLMRYEDRWGEALPGTHAMAHLTDEMIVAKIDSTHATQDARSEEYHRRMARYAYRGLPETQR